MGLKEDQRPLYLRAWDSVTDDSMQLSRMLADKEKELAAANQRADEAGEAFRNAQTALVQTGRQLGQAEKLLRKVNSIGFTGPLADEIRSFLTTKKSGDEVPDDDAAKDDKHNG